ncbi:MAG: tetratricopeptide repeat protein, partial [Anaerolineae bacterium]
LPAGSIATHNDLAEALQLARQIASPSAEAWALWAQCLWYTGQGQFGRALDAVQGALEIATAIDHHEWMAGSQSILGALYVDMLAPEEARPQLEQALARAERLHSRHWIHHATGCLAVACWLLDDRTQARVYLDAVLSPGTGMDSVHKRTCWARRAELALLEGDPSLALEIVERLIDSAPGMSPGRVIAFLWKVKAEALAAVGQTEQAGMLLQAAVENAQATGERTLLWPIHASLARLYKTTHHRAEAATESAAARRLILELADTIPAPRLREGFLRRAHGMLEPVP